ncbi:DNA primase [Aequitasia blattaphilus]|uniref:DNA primase n=1 Tax=Aequitasia blattaphilus TaxID=2949332 RepID=A0ABT1E6Q5_9FIRM|nr:DNA primase [Aequitasia blattaphilus]MCP1101517.1 DNA primase [Aequitasia blattaphilus]MCR8614157.1 DNA primase [Aequitasia blattaphilus]
MFYPEEIIEEVRSRNDIVDVISSYVKLQKKGSTHFGLCPFHNEKTPSFSVSQGKQMYYCFGCGAGGNVLTFIMEYENYSFPEALKVLADRAGIDLPEENNSKEEKKKSDERLVLKEINKLAAQFFYTALRKNNRGLEYLENREIQNDTIVEFGLGYSPKDSRELYRYLKSKGYSDEILLKSGLFSGDEKNGAYCKFWNRIMFPIMDGNNRVIGFGGRVMGSGEPKYLNSPETPIFDKSRNLYGLNFARKARAPYFLLCEGYLDVISLHQNGFPMAVASLGTAFTSGQASLIRRYVQEIYLTYDSDEAGTKAALRALPILKEAGISAKIIRMEPYKDPDELLKKAGREEFEKRIKEARNGFLFSLEVLERDYDLNSPEEKTMFFKEVATRLSKFEEDIERNNYIEAVARSYHVAYEDLKKLVAKTAISLGQAKPVNRPKNLDKGAKKEEGIITAQKLLLTWIAENEGVFRSLKEYLKEENFTTPLYREVARKLYEQYETGEPNPAKLMNFFTDEAEHKEVASLFHTKIRELSTSTEQEKAIRDSLIKVKNASIEKNTKELDPTDMEGLQRLMKDKKELQELQKIKIQIQAE